MTLAKQVLAILALAQAVSAQNGGSSLSGRVVNSQTKAGIAGVELLFCRLRSPSVNSDGLTVVCEPSGASAVTDDTGYYRVTGLSEGQYAVVPTGKEGFGPPIPPSPAVTVTGDAHLDLEMTPSASLRGRVLDPEGNPAPGYVVAVDSKCNGCTALQVSISNQDGEYSFTDLPPIGPFVVSVSPKAQDSKAEEKIVTTYYPSAIERDLAQAIPAQGGDSFGYDIKLRTASARSVRGTVLDDAGKPVPKALVSIVKPATGIFEAIRGFRSPDFQIFAFETQPVETPLAEPTETRGDGTFTFPAVIEGAWMLRVVGGMPKHVGSSTVNVGDGDVEGIEVRIAPAFDMALETDWGEKAPAKQPANPVNLIPIDTPRSDFPLLFGNLRPGEVARFQGFAGSYLVAPVRGPVGYYLAQALLDNRDVLGQVARIEAGDTLKLVFRTDGGTVRGTVEKGGGAAVILMADPTASGRLGYSALCDGSGAFVADDIPPGEYTAIAVQGRFDPASVEFATMLASSGKRVRVEAAAAAQVDLRVADR